MLVLKNNLSGLGKSAKCGWVCRTLRKVGDVLNSVGLGSIGGPLKVAADVISFAETALAPADNTLTIGGGWDDNLRKTDLILVDEELTPSEENVLNQWESEKLTPYYKILATELENALSQNYIEDKVLGINSVLTKMEVIASHFKVNDKIGLSNNAVLVRSQLINELFKPMYDVIELELTGSDYNKIFVSYSVSSSVPTYAPLFILTNSRTVSSRNYSREIASLAPTKPLPITQPAIPQVLPIGVGATSTGTNTGTKSKKSFIQKNGLYIVGGIAVAAVLLSGKKKKKASS